MVKTKNDEYVERVNRVLDYLHENYAEDVSLQTLATVANFSEFHFHRIFKAHLGESLYKYIQRIRIEKAANRLTYESGKSITEIALDCGFTNSASFARTFKEYFSVSASEWRKRGETEFSKNRKVDSKNGMIFGKLCKEYSISEFYIDPTTNNLNWRITMTTIKDVTVEVQENDETTVAYIRHIGKFKGEQAKWIGLFTKLANWAGPRGLLKCPGTEYFTVFRDEPNITDFSQFKADVCITVEPGTQADGEIGVTTIAGGKYAVAQFEIDADQYEEAWNFMFTVWLPQSGFQPDDRCCYEKYLNDPKRHPQNKHFLEVAIPVKPL